LCLFTCGLRMPIRDRLQLFLSAYSRVQEDGFCSSFQSFQLSLSSSPVLLATCFHDSTHCKHDLWKLGCSGPDQCKKHACLLLPRIGRVYINGFCGYDSNGSHWWNILHSCTHLYEGRSIFAAAAVVWMVSSEKTGILDVPDHLDDFRGIGKKCLCQLF